MKFPVFKRKFAFSMYKDLRLELGKMTFAKDFTRTDRGDLYPVLEKSADCVETVAHHQYHVQSGTVRRWIAGFFPFGSYELTGQNCGGSAGFVFALPDGREARILLTADEVVYTGQEGRFTHPIPEKAGAAPVLLVSCRPGAFDIYFTIHGRPEYCTTFTAPSFDDTLHQHVFSSATVSLAVTGPVIVHRVEAFLDNGVSIADMRPIRYEDGSVMLESGRLHFTASIRLESGAFQGVFSWVPGTAQFELTGALFFDCGDGMWGNDVASSILFHRERQEWLLWVASFCHGHVLGHGVMAGDPRFGVNVVDIQLMPHAPEGAPVETFAGFGNDEDPDFYYDAARDKWHMAICRTDGAYRYFFYESEDPFTGYRCTGKGLGDGAETGGSFVNIRGQRFFICGNDFHKRSNYRIYSKDGMEEACFDFPDGGFRGWGTLIPVPAGSRMRYYWLTFDRQLGSNYNWSYGNLYCFEGIFE